MRRAALSIVALTAFAAAHGQVVLPTTAHVANNAIPFGANQTAVHHQVFRANLFGATPVIIQSIGFAPGTNATYTLDFTLRLGYTNRIPGVGSAAGGLSIPSSAGGGGPNAVGAMTTFFSNPSYTFTSSGAGTNNFSNFLVTGSFVYDPSLGNLLVETQSVTGASGFSVSRTGGSAESSRAYFSTSFTPAESPTTALRMQFTFVPVPEPGTIAVLGLGALALLRRRRVAK
jgi:hypothetical protein